MIAIAGIRSSRGEDRMLIDAPGHILSSGEKDFYSGAPTEEIRSLLGIEDWTDHL
jgi:hypothetical protein